MKFNTLSRCIAAGLIALSAAGAQAAAIHDAGLFTNQLARNDDGSTGSVALGFSADFYGTTTSSAFVNNNGNITFASPLSTFTPFGIQTNLFAIIAPFFADVDTRNALSGITSYGAATLDGHNVFGVNWIDVGYFSQQANLRNSFQLIMTDRGDTGAGNFDMQFNYDQIQWETGGASGGVNGFGGTPAAAGYTAGDHVNFYEFAGSRVSGSFLDTNATTGLIYNSLNSETLGQYNFQVRGGAVVSSVPEPETYLMMALGLAAIGFASRKRKQA
jgi:hypothetical protein